MFTSADLRTEQIPDIFNGTIGITSANAEEITDDSGDTGLWCVPMASAVDLVEAEPVTEMCGGAVGLVQRSLHGGHQGEVLAFENNIVELVTGELSSMRAAIKRLHQSKGNELEKGLSEVKESVRSDMARWKEAMIKEMPQNGAESTGRKNMAELETRLVQRLIELEKPSPAHLQTMQTGSC
ncbi:hypothetical protein WMY93_032914 [Mugilogobius chulae]|uniref:Uncharacterized protein n=1 Tax=Mugilogobius chulae TaxID=88201 RepID=A0AAW0MLR8_9GOBI